MERSRPAASPAAGLLHFGAPHVLESNQEDVAMTASRKGVLSGRTITLESEVPPLGGG